MLCYFMLCYVMLYYIILRYVILCYVMLYYITLCYVILCYVMLYYIISYYIILYNVMYTLNAPSKCDYYPDYCEQQWLWLWFSVSGSTSRFSAAALLWQEVEVDLKVKTGLDPWVSSIQFSSQTSQKETNSNFSMKNFNLRSWTCL